MKNLLTSIFLFSSVQVFSWGLTGHRVVGHIAMDHLEPAVKAHILNVLEGEDLAMVANWMDFIKSEPSYDSLNAWHYCTIEDGADIEHHHTPDQGDVWMAIEKFLKEIETQHYSVDEAFALRALAHFIGDVHQPLHCGNGTDMGGNQVKVKFFYENSNLHRVWDSGMIDYWQMSYTEYSTWIMATKSNEEVQRWKESSVKDWIAESVAVRDQCYQTGDLEKMGYRYIYDHSDLLHERLAQAGVRLASALNKAYAARG
jgi:hypothetical protein